MSSISTDRVPLVTLELPPSRRPGRLLRVRPFRSIELPRPRATPSGLFPAVPVQPEPPIGLALRLRRAVAWTVVLGTVALLAYAVWPRLAHGATTSHDSHASRPSVP